jgi:YmaF family
MSLIIGAIRPHHAHFYFTETTVSKDHFHILKGFTKPVNGNSFDRHFHRYLGITSFDNKHYHRYYGKTGPAIPLSDGGHYHELDNRTYYNYDEPLEVEFGGVLYDEQNRPKHEHFFKGRTSEPVGYDPFLSGYL